MSRNPVPQNENSEARFVRVFQPRIQAAIAKIRLVENATGSQYTYSPAQVDAIESALNAATAEMVSRLRGIKGDTRPVFKLA